MILHGTQKINERGHLEIGGCDTVELAAEYGTPLYIMDEALIRGKCRAYVKAFAGHYPDALTLYASKAFMCTAMCRIVQQEGLGLDVVSGGELYTALKSGFPVDKIYFHGNNKSVAEMDMGLQAGISRFVVDNMYELETLAERAGSARRKADILLRITPGIKPKTHSYVQTGQIDSKFGLGIENGLAMKAVKRTLELESLNLTGLHCHIGSQLFGMDSYDAAVGIMMDLLASIRRETDLVLTELNIGGGLGIRYIEKHDPATVDEHVSVISGALLRKAEELDYPAPRLINEPGRSIVGEAGTTLYTVGSVKDIPNVRKYVAVDGGMADNPRFALYGSEYEAIVANRADAPALETVSIAGKCCESGDMLIKDILLPEIRTGDLLAVQCTGAYNYSMASNYNRLTVPGTVLVRDGISRIIIQPESLEDLVSRDVIPKDI